MQTNSYPLSGRRVSAARGVAGQSVATSIVYSVAGQVFGDDFAAARSRARAIADVSGGDVEVWAHDGGGKPGRVADTVTPTPRGLKPHGRSRRKAAVAPADAPAAPVPSPSVQIAPTPEPDRTCPQCGRTKPAGYFERIPKAGLTLDGHPVRRRVCLSCEIGGAA